MSEELDRRVKKLEVVVLGDHEYRTTGMADKFDQLVVEVNQIKHDVASLVTWMNEERAAKEKAKEQTKKILGWFTPRDIVAAVGFIGGVIAVLSKIGWLK